MIVLSDGKSRHTLDLYRNHGILGGGLIGFELVIEIVEHHPNEELPAIFADNHAVVIAFKTSREPSGQFMLQRISPRKPNA